MVDPTLGDYLCLALSQNNVDLIRKQVENIDNGFNQCQRLADEFFISGDALRKLKESMVNIVDVIQQALYTQNSDVVKLLIEKCKVWFPVSFCWQVQQKINEGFIKSCAEHNWDMMNTLMQQGANDLDRAIIAACEYNHTDMFECIYDIANRNKIILDWFKILCQACKNGNQTIIQKAQPHLQHGHAWNGPFEYACMGGKLDAAQLCILNGADKHELGLKRACQYGHLEIVKWLMEHTFLRCKPNNEILEAINRNHAHIVEYFADINKHNRCFYYDRAITASLKCYTPQITQILVAREPIGWKWEIFLQSGCHPSLSGPLSKMHNMMRLINCGIHDLPANRHTIPLYLNLGLPITNKSFYSGECIFWWTRKCRGDRIRKQSMMTTTLKQIFNTNFVQIVIHPFISHEMIT